MHLPGFTAESGLPREVGSHFEAAPARRDQTGRVVAQFGYHKGCCLDSGDCDGTWCVGDKAHLECNNGKANMVCDGCFLTTACVMARGLPDDCLELQTLRKFRDSYLNSSRLGRQEVARYYRLAPKICKLIDSQPHPSVVYGEIYRGLVRKAVRLITNGRLREAFSHYRRYTLVLAARLGVQSD